ncbi:MAG TPA: hypothetical protein PKI59_03115, partial [Candidatus Cloacimonadota bacterium]|nr:hypothetical protein [Candidatus Cloacimonadota bacterium]
AIDEKYYRANLYQAAAGIHILSVPLLILILFWSILGFILRNNLMHILQNPEEALYINIIVMSMLILMGFYLAHLLGFILKLRGYFRLVRRTHAR